MQKKITKWKESCYDIEFVLTLEDSNKAKDKVLKDFQKDLNLPGFRKGFVPMHLVEENIKPEYLSMGIYEQLINFGLKEILDDNNTLRFIGEPYDLKQEKKWEDTLITLKLDVFPEIETKNDDWENYNMKTISSKATKEEVNEALVRLKKNYADYKDTDTVTYDSISKVALKFNDKDWNELDKWIVYVGEQEFDEFEYFKKHFIGKSKWQDFSLDYVEKDLPPTMQSKKSDVKVAKIVCNILDVKSIVLPEINEETLKKLFGNDAKVKNEKELLEYIEENITQQKFEVDLIKEIEDFLKVVREKHMTLEMPKTLLNQEFSSRIQNLEKKFGWPEKTKQYFDQMWEEKAKSFLDDIKLAAKESLEKFFILQKVSDLLELDVNWDKPGHLEIEQKLYDKLTSKKSENKSENKSDKKDDHKENHKEESVKPAKKPAKK